MMIVGAMLIELHVHGSASLKQKRGVVKSISQRLRNRFNVSVAEVGGQDTWQRAVLGISMVGSEPVGLRRTLERVVDFVEDLHLAEVRDVDLELLPLEHEDGAGAVLWLDEGEPEEPAVVREREERAKREE